MVYYFSGTGNSKWVAQELARRTGDEAQDIAALIKDGPTAVYAGKDARIGVVFPIYAWGVPTIMERFCKSITLAQGAYAYAVCTCGGSAGNAMKRLKRFFLWRSAWSIMMPNNYIIGYDVDTPEEVARLKQDASEKIDSISKKILSSENAYDVSEGKGAGIKTALVRPMFNRFARRTKPFYATDACNSCGQCVRDCPVKAIRLDGGKPHWVNRSCEQCLSCINRCPQKAIQYGRGTASKGRYFFCDSM